MRVKSVRVVISLAILLNICFFLGCSKKSEEKRELPLETLAKAKEIDFVQRVLVPDANGELSLEDRLAIVVPPEMYSSEPVWQENDRLLKNIGSIVFAALKANDIGMVKSIRASKDDIMAFQKCYGLQPPKPGLKEFKELVDSRVDENFVIVHQKIDWSKVAIEQMRTEVRKTDSYGDVLYGSTYMDLVWQQSPSKKEQKYKTLEVDDLVLTPNGYRIISVGRWLYLE